MRIVRFVLSALVLASAGAVAQAPDVPCGAVRTAALPPCDAPAPTPAPAPAPPAAGGTPLGEDDLPAELRARLAGADASVAAARRGALEAEIADTRLRLEAARRGLSFRDYWRSEVLKKTPRPTDADIGAEYERARKSLAGKTLEDLRPRIESVLLARARAKREAEVAASLATRYPAVPGADAGAPGLPPDTVLATVGGRAITARSAATRLDAAAFAVRRDLHYETLDALEGKPAAFRVDAPSPPALSLDLAGAPSRGPASAPVVVAEFADFECPHCAGAWEAAEEALAPYGDRVRYVFRNFPLPFHEHARKAAEAARAAQAQGRFFEMAALLFRNQKSLDTPSLKAYAARAGCDPARFAADLDSGRFAADVLLEAREAERLRVDGTPAFFVNGVWLPWEAANVQGIRAAVDAALAKGPAPAAAAAARPSAP